MADGETKYFAYGQLEIEHLKEADPVLGLAMERLGKVERIVMPDLFAALIYAIVGQLISAKAAETIWTRMQEQLGEMTPSNLAVQEEEAIRRCGLTRNKAVGISSIARSLERGEWSLDALRGMPDEEAIRSLTRFNGVGRWTAEMVLLHALERPDVVSWGDAAIRRGMMRLYGLSSLTKPQFEQYRRRYAPYGSVASIYLWAISV